MINRKCISTKNRFLSQIGGFGLAEVFPIINVAVR